MLAFGRQILHELRRLFEHLQRLLQIDNVDPVALTEDVFLHLGVPALRLMPEVNTRFEQLLHGDVSQTTSSLVCIRELVLFDLSDYHSRPRAAKHGKNWTPKFSCQRFSLSAKT